MKCPICGHNQKVKDGLKCGGCDYEFAFNPKDSETWGMTDGKFDACLRTASQKNTAWFTENQLYAVYCRRQKGVVLPWLIAGAVLLAAAVYVGVSYSGPLAIFVGFFAASCFLAALGSAMGSNKTRRSHFQKLLQRWSDAGKPLERMIERPSLREPPPKWNEPDIYDYGVERILIVEREILVDLYVKNDVHAEQRMLVLAESGYPEYLLPVARRLLEERPDLPVFLLHDATPAGVAMQERLSASGLLPLDGHPVADLGMFPSDFQKLKRTKLFDPENRPRELPVDALMLPFMAAGLTQAMAQGTTFGNMIEEKQDRSGYAGTSDFG